MLDALARALQSDALAGFSFRVEGHSDARGDEARNMELSQLRAEAVAAYLVKTHGILAERLSRRQGFERAAQPAASRRAREPPGHHRDDAVAAAG